MANATVREASKKASNSPCSLLPEVIASRICGDSTSRSIQVTQRAVSPFVVLCIAPSRYA